MMSELRDSAPQYPGIHIHLESDNPFAWVAAVRLALRRAAVDHPEIARFTEEALTEDDPAASRRVCRSWVEIEH